MKNLPNINELKAVRENKKQEALKRIKKETLDLLRDTKELSVKVLMTNDLGETSFHEPIQKLYRESMNEGVFYDHYRGNLSWMERQLGDIYCEMFNKKFGSQGYKALRSGSIIIISWED